VCPTLSENEGDKMPIMRKRHIFLFFCCVFVALVSVREASAQYGTAPNNYYPDGYHGATFTGTIAQINNEAITLTYTHGNKTDTFQGYVATPCNMPASKTTVVKTGAVITVFYEPEIIKTNGQKVKKNKIVGISFKEVDGKTIADNERRIFYCISAPFQSYFKAFQ
jgi:hypothetical protein